MSQQEPGNIASRLSDHKNHLLLSADSELRLKLSGHWRASGNPGTPSYWVMDRVLEG